LAVVATIFPLYDFARTIGGSAIDLSLLVPPGTDPHDFQPAPDDISKIADARIFITAGNAMDPWSKSATAAVNNPTQTAVDASAGINTATIDADGKTTNSNPHVWLDFSNAQIMVGNIATALESSDPANKEIYRQNAANYQKQLDDLDARYQSELANCATKILVEGGHDAFDFMTRRYNLTYLPTQGADPDAEPLPQKMAQLADVIKNNKLKDVFFEELESKKSAQTLADETGTQLLALNPGETVSTNDFADNITMIQIMERNLANLKTGLQCQ
jgi:zinc transport system substrate-binding protein